jgi:predicted enzyme related to lactoylglutathione lyase
MFTTIAHIQLLVNSYDETIKFYTEKLGFVLIDDQPMPMMGESMRWVVIAPQKDTQTMVSVALATKEPTLNLVGKQGGSYPFLTLFTADIDNVFKTCLNNGVKIVKEISETPWGKDMVIEDLYGNQIYIVQEPKK